MDEKNPTGWVALLANIFGAAGESPQRYRTLRWRMIILMVLVTLLPLFLMAVMNHYQYQKALKGEVVQPIRGLLNKTKHSLGLFLAERQSAVSFIASAYTFEELADQKTLQRVFLVMKREFGGFVDLGLIDPSGLQVSYVGPYDLLGKNYAEQPWFHEVRVRGRHVSDVFMGFRKFPHVVIAVKHLCPENSCWVLRATIDTDQFNHIIAAMGLEASDDAFLLNSEGVLQTPSKYYGKVLDRYPLALPPVSVEPNVLEVKDTEGQDLLVGYTYFESPDFILMLIKSSGEVMKSWYTLKSELFYVFVVSVVIILIVVFKLTGVMVKRLEESEQKRALVYHQMEYTNKLASIGRLAAGVAHEINNPLAIINEKAGLMEDLIQGSEGFAAKEKFLKLTNSILQSVDRCRLITHRLLGFARRMDVSIEVIDLHELIREVLGFLEKEAMHRNIDIRLQLDDNLPKIASDRGQLQQVFLNITNNAFAAVDDGGTVTITSWEPDIETVGISIQDNGVGMSEPTLKHIFEPFFTTKKGHGTGLGLSITYGIVKKLGGDIQVQSKEGIGTTFNVFLPKKPKESAES